MEVRRPLTTKSTIRGRNLSNLNLVTDSANELSQDQSQAKSKIVVDKNRRHLILVSKDAQDAQGKKARSSSKSALRNR